MRQPVNRYLPVIDPLYIWTVGISIILFLAGQLLFIKSFTLFEPQVEGILFQITERQAPLKTSILFSLSIFFIPFLTVFTWKLGHISSLFRRIASTLLIFLCIVLGIFARHQQVKTYFTTVVRPALLTGGKTSIVYPIDPRIFVYYILAGLITGCTLGFVLFKTGNQHTP